MIREVNSFGLRAGAFVALVAICLPSAGMAAEHRPAALTTEELCQRLVDCHARIRAWYVEYESSRELSAVNPAYLHRVVAAKAPDRFFHWSAHGTAELDWREDPYQQRLILTPGMAASERPLYRQFRLLSLAPNAPLPGTSPMEFLFTTLGWWPFEKRPPPLLAADVPRVLPAIARSPKYVVNSRQELVRGRWCHILEYPGHDRLWLDCDHGCAIMAREVFDPKKGVLLQRTESSGHREIQPGIWVPFEFRNMLFDAAAPEPQEVRGIKTLDATLKVLKVRLNEQVEDDFFHFEPLPGSIEITEDNLVKREVPGATDYLNEVVDWIRRHVRFSAIPVGDSDSTTEALLEYSIIGGGIAALIALFFRRRRYYAGHMPKNVAADDALAGSKEKGM
jgi:hypothetical protein